MRDENAQDRPNWAGFRVIGGAHGVTRPTIRARDRMAAVSRPVAQTGRWESQPGGLADGSRWSCRAKRGTTTGKPRRIGRAPRRGARPGSDVLDLPSNLHRDESGTPGRGCRRSPAPLPGGRRPPNPRRPPATLWQPFGLTDPECPNSTARWTPPPSNGRVIWATHPQDTPGGDGGTFLVSSGLRNGYIQRQRFYGWALAGAAYMRSSSLESSPGRTLGGGRPGGPARAFAATIDGGAVVGCAGRR